MLNLDSWYINRHQGLIPLDVMEGNNGYTRQPEIIRTVVYVHTPSPLIAQECLLVLCASLQ